MNYYYTNKRPTKRNTYFSTLLLLVLTYFMGLQTTQAQNTLIPDPIFEQVLINLGYDTGLINGSIPTANISEITSLSVSSMQITD